MRDMNATRTIPLVERWIICIPGYLQRRGSSRAAIPALHRELAFAHAGPTCWVEMFPWHSDWRDVAEWIVQSSAPRPRIDVFAYSWGVGFGFLRLAKYLRRHDIEIQNAVLCDGVAHVGPGFAGLHTLSKLLAFLPAWEIVIPDNVRAVYPLRQEQTRLRGHAMRCADPNATRLAPFVLDPHRGHTEMDESPSFLGLCKAIAKYGRPTPADLRRPVDGPRLETLGDRAGSGPPGPARPPSENGTRCDNSPQPPNGGT